MAKKTKTYDPAYPLDTVTNSITRIHTSPIIDHIHNTDSTQLLGVPYHNLAKNPILGCHHKAGSLTVTLMMDMDIE
jgi:hypothetical protein